MNTEAPRDNRDAYYAHKMQLFYVYKRNTRAEHKKPG